MVSLPGDKPTLKRIALSALSLIPSICLAASPGLAPDLASADPRGVVDVIVQFNVPAQQQHASISQLGGVHRADMGIINGAVYSIPVVALGALANNPNVTYVSPDRPVQATLDTANPAVGAELALANGLDGTNVGIAIIDSGILQTNDLLDKTPGSPNASRIVYSASFVPKVTSTADQFGHGTHVAGIIAGNATVIHRHKLLQNFSRHGSQCQADQSPGPGWQWRRNRQQRHQCDRRCHPA